MRNIWGLSYVDVWPCSVIAIIERLQRALPGTGSGFAKTFLSTGRPTPLPEVLGSLELLRDGDSIDGVVFVGVEDPGGLRGADYVSIGVIYRKLVTIDLQA